MPTTIPFLCHSKVGELPPCCTDAVKLSMAPSQIEDLLLTIVIAGVTGAVTSSVAGTENTGPQELIAAQRYLLPVSPGLAPLITKVFELAPEYNPPFGMSFHTPAESNCH